MKKCSNCNIEKPESDFYKHSRTKSGLSSYCKICSSQYGKKWVEKNWAKRRASNLRYYYGVDFEYFESLRDAQENKCAICQSPFTDEKHTHLDHCHSTKAVRGILCNHCNRGLGAFKDSTENLESALKYLKKYSSDFEKK